MKTMEQIDSLKVYSTPSLRVLETKQDLSFLASNLEPIDGGGDPDIEW